MRQLRERVGLVHELRELRGPEELFDRGDDRPDVDQRLRRDRLDVLHRHALAHDPLQAQQADAELVLQQLADRADAAVAEMVDVVDVDLLGRDLDQAAHDRDHVFARQAALLDRRNADAAGDVLALELARELVAADAREIVALVVEEQRLEQLLGVLGVLGLARTELLVDLLERVLTRLDVVIFVERVLDQGRVVEERQNRFVRLPAEAEIGTRERADERRDVDLAVLVDTNADRALGLVVLRAVVGLELDPRAAVRNDRRVVRRAVVRVEVFEEVDARRADELRDDHPLGTIDHEGALVGHEREIAHEDLLVGDALDFARLRRDQADANAQRRRVGHVALAALFDRVLRLAEAVLAELQHEVAGEILDRGDRRERIGQALADEPLEARLLQFDQIGDLEDVRNLRKGMARAGRPGIVVRLDGESVGRHGERRREILRSGGRAGAVVLRGLA